MNDSFENRIEERSLTLFEMAVTVIPSVRICENSRFFLRYGSAAPCLLRMIGRADFPSSAKRVSRETNQPRAQFPRVWRRRETFPSDFVLRGRA